MANASARNHRFILPPLGRDRLEQLHHRLVGPEIRILVDLLVTARADRRIDVLALAEAVPELLHLVRRHVVQAPSRRRLGHQPHTHQKTNAKPTGSTRANRSIVDMRVRSVGSSSALRLSFFARSFAALLSMMYSNT